MSDIMRPRYGTKAENDGYIGLDGEISIDRETQHLRIHDGVTAGGAKVVANQDEVKVIQDGLQGLQEAVDSIDVGVTSVNGNTGEVTPDQTGCLPLSGGTMKGTIKTSTTSALQSTNNTSAIQVYGGVGYGNGAYINLRGKDHSTEAGIFSICATEGTTNKILMGKPDGALTWENKNIVRSVNGTEADGSGNVTVAYAQGIGQSSMTKPAVVIATWRSGTSWYRKWSDGFVEQGGQATNSAGSFVAVTFTVSMNTVLFVTPQAMRNDKNYLQKEVIQTGSITTTGFSGCVTDYAQNKIAGTFCWYACGYVQ